MIWAGFAALILFLVWQIIRWWNLPKVAEERTEKVELRQDGWTERLKLRLGFRLKKREMKNSRDVVYGNFDCPACDNSSTYRVLLQDRYVSLECTKCKAMTNFARPEGL